MTGTLRPVAGIRLLRAIDRAANDEGWATASAIRHEFDGGTSAAGPWAKSLWELEAQGLAEARAVLGTRFLWGLTEAGASLLLREDMT